MADVKIIQSDRHIEKIRDKDNCIMIGVFKKYHCKLERNDNHVVLVNPSDTGNLGTIIRSCVGFGINNLAIIEPAVDIFHVLADIIRNTEPSGLDNSYLKKGKSVVISHTHSIDSLNLSLAVGIGIYEFGKSAILKTSD